MPSGRFYELIRPKRYISMIYVINLARIVETPCALALRTIEKQNFLRIFTVVFKYHKDARPSKTGDTDVCVQTALLSHGRSRAN